MAGNRAIYEQAMQAGNDSAWDQDWTGAIKNYAQALKEFPEDSMALNSLGLSLLESGQYEDALKVYTRAYQLHPDDPVPLEKCADVLERLGRLQDAAQRYVAVAEVYLGQRDYDKAIGNWERATRLTPGLLQIHARLAQAYERIGQKRSALREYLTLAFNFQRTGDRERALQFVERALRLEPSNPQAINAREAIARGADMLAPEVDDENGAVEPGSAQEFIDVAEEETSTAGGSHPDGPLGEATEKALASLAEVVFTGNLSAATSQVIQAIELQKIGDNQAALESFQRAEAGGMRYPAMFMSMGTLLIKLERWADAQKYLERAKSENDYTAGVAHGMGRALMGLKQTQAAAQQLINALRLVDTGLAVTTGEFDELTAVYNDLMKGIQNRQEMDVAAMNQQIVKMLTGPDWKVRIRETLRSIAQRPPGEDPIPHLINPEMVNAVSRIDTYIRQRLLTLAMDEAFRVIETQPDLLSVHQRIAQILMEEGHTQAAINKYNMVANTYLARDQVNQAADILNEVITIAPMDINLRTSLIELLEREQQYDKLLDEYISLANAHYQLADFEQARATYQEAMRLAQRVNAAPGKRAEVLHHMADIDMSRLDLRSAMRNYEQIRTLDPNDVKARQALVDINYRLNNQLDAVKELDGLLRLYAQQRRGDLIVSTLERMVSDMPNDMALRSRMAAVYRQTNRKVDAIAQLDALADLQLDAGLIQDACATIKQIIALGTPDAEQYKNLLTQLGC